MGTTIKLDYTDDGFSPSTAPASPGDTIRVSNETDNAIELSFSAGQVAEPLIGLTSPVQVPGRGGKVSGVVDVTASNHAIVFSANSYEANIEVGAASYQVTVSPESSSPADLTCNPLDIITFYNESASQSVNLAVDGSTPDPLGPELGSDFSIDPTGTKIGIAQASARNTKVKVTVKGSSSATTTISVGSGDVEGVLARDPLDVAKRYI